MLTRSLYSEAQEEVVEDVMPGYLFFFLMLNQCAHHHISMWLQVPVKNLKL